MVKINGHDPVVKKGSLSNGIRGNTLRVLLPGDEWPNNIFSYLQRKIFLCDFPFLFCDLIMLKKDPAINIFHYLAPVSDCYVIYEYIYQSKENNCSVVVLNVSNIL